MLHNWHKDIEMHTLGKWIINKQDIEVITPDKHIKPVCTCHISFAVSDEDLANMRLISAAPDMFEALSFIKAVTSVPMNMLEFDKVQYAIKLVDSALNKVNGIK